MSQDIRAMLLPPAYSEKPLTVQAISDFWKSTLPNPPTEQPSLDEVQEALGTVNTLCRSIFNLSHSLEYELPASQDAVSLKEALLRRLKKWLEGFCNDLDTVGDDYIPRAPYLNSQPILRLLGKLAQPAGSAINGHRSWAEFLLTSYENVLSYLAGKNEQFKRWHDASRQVDAAKEESYLKQFQSGGKAVWRKRPRLNTTAGVSSLEVTEKTAWEELDASRLLNGLLKVLPADDLYGIGQKVERELTRLAEQLDDKETSVEETDADSNNPPAKYAALIATTGHIKGKQKRLLVLLCDHGGRLELSRLALDPQIKWDAWQYEDAFNSMAQRLSKKLLKLRPPWRVHRHGNSAVLEQGKKPKKTK